MEVPSLVTAEWLQGYIESNKETLGSPKLRILDGSWHPPATGRKGSQEWKASHIPGALYFDLYECEDKSFPPERYMLPSTEQFEQYVGALGIDNNTHVVIYDNNSKFSMISAPRVWWMFKAFGHDNVSILDGGLPNWMRVTEDLTTEDVPVFPASVFKANFREEIVRSFEELEQLVREREKTPFQLLDGRPPGMFHATFPDPTSGPKHGHVPGARNVPFFSVMDGTTKRVHTEESLRKIFEGVNLDEPITIMCLGGVTSVCVLFALHLLKAKKVALYDGSWEEWYRRAGKDMMVLKK